MFGVKIKISGGLGGHSGVVIGETRINALVESLNILKTLADKYNFNIVEIKTQNPANAIPDRVEVILDVNKNQNDAFFKDYTDLFNEMKKSYQLEKNIELEITSNINQKSLTHNVTTKILNLIIGSFSGLNKYDFRFDIPEASSNLSSINISEDQIKMH
jgi:acetylornithine deacetylase/succinyl-diaminopimelate desuccinylase-like protein